MPPVTMNKPEHDELRLEKLLNLQKRYGAFVGNPSAENWNELESAMLEYQHITKNVRVIEKRVVRCPRCGHAWYDSG